MNEPPHSFLFHGLVYWVGKMLARSISIVLLPIFTAYLRPAEYGVLSILGMVLNVFMLVLSFQLPSAIYRYWAKAKTSEDKIAIMGTSFVATVCFPFFCLLPLYVWAEPFAHLLGIENAKLMRLIFVEVQISLILAIFLADMRIHDESQRYAFIEILQNLSIGLLSICFVVFMGWGITGMIVAQVVVFSLLTIWCAPHFFTRIPLCWDWNIFRQMIRFSFPLIPAAVAMAAVHTSDRLFLQQIMGNAAVGIYAIGYKFSMLVSFLITGPFSLLWEPKSFEIAQKEGSEKKFGEIFTYLVVGVSFVAVFLTGMSREIVTLMVAKEYISAYKVIPLVAWSYVFFAMAIVVRVGLLIEKKTVLSAWLVFFIFMVNVVGNIIMIPRFGVKGAALATLLSFIVYFFVNLLCSQRYIPILFELRKLAILLVLIVVSLLIMWNITIADTFLLVLSKLFVVLCFFFLLVFFGFFERLQIIDKIKAKFCSVPGE